MIIQQIPLPPSISTLVPLSLQYLDLPKPKLIELGPKRQVPVWQCCTCGNSGIPIREAACFEGALRAACIVATGSVMLVLAMHLAARYPPHARLIRALVLSVGVLDLPFLPAYLGSPLYAGLSLKYGQLRLMMALYVGAPVLSSILDTTPASTASAPSSFRTRANDN
ncbi:hypothetical protein CGCFRS4_v015970 [Colletotrichum fructicola]|nr:hypothetical protein CGCFRS4_v015970 [Colletotrichum fructicola]